MLVPTAGASGLPPVGQALLSHLSLFGSIGNAERHALLALSGSIARLAANEDITRLGLHASTIVVVLDGVLKRFIDDAKGNRQICGLYLRGDAPGLETLQMPIADHRLSALAPSIVGLLPRSQVEAMLQQFPALQGLVWRETLVQSSMLRAWLLRNSMKDAAGQLAHLFCEWLIRARAAGIAQGNSCPLPLSQRHLAEVTGMSMVHVNRTLMVLRGANLIQLADGVLTVHRWDELAALAEFTPDYLHLGDSANPVPTPPALPIQSRTENSIEFVPSRGRTAHEEPDAFRRKVAEYKQVLKAWSFVSSGLMRGEPDELRTKLTRLAGDLRTLAGDSPERQATMEMLSNVFQQTQRVAGVAKNSV